MSTDTLDRKLEVLMDTIGFTKEAIASNPAILRFSVDRRLLPRYHAMLPFKLTSTVLFYTNERFEQQLKGLREEAARRHISAT
jgi:hypothetical protein